MLENGVMLAFHDEGRKLSSPKSSQTMGVFATPFTVA
jgi:hypothetical protein